MAIEVKTSTPKWLLDAIKKAIDEGKTETWEYDADGDFTHKPEQWRNKAWLSPQVSAGALNFGIIGTKRGGVSKLVYGVYHGRFIEMLLSHFDDDFSTASATAQLKSGIDLA
jgi:hypothetical protein